MAVTLPTVPEFLQLAETREGQPICVGVRDELAALNRLTTRAFASGNGVSRLVISSPKSGYGTGASGIPLTVGFVIIARVKIRLWGQAARFRTVIKGSYASVYIRVGGGGGALLPLATVGAGPAWGPGSTAAVAGAVIDADGFTEVWVYVKYTSTAHDLHHIVLEELPVQLAALPTPATPSSQGYFPLDDGAFVAGAPLDVWSLQALDDAVERVKLERSRAGAWGTTGRPYYLQSVHWRLAGPFMIAAAPGADRATVVVTMRLKVGTTDHVDLCVVSEWERFDQVVDDRKQTITSTAENFFTFDDVKLRPGGIDEKVHRVWIGFRSHIGASLNSPVVVGAYDPSKPYRLYTDNSLSASAIPLPIGICGWTGQNDVLQYKSIHAFPDLLSFFDIAVIEGEELYFTAPGDPVRSVMRISPSPSTGWTSIPQFMPAGIYGSTQVWFPTVDIHSLGVAELMGVSIEAREPLDVPRKLAQPGAPPSSSLVREIAEGLNRVTRQHTPVLAIGHHGGRNLTNTIGGYPNIGPIEGNWIFIKSAPNGEEYTFEVPLTLDPNNGAIASGLLIEKVYAQFCYMVVSTQTGPSSNQGSVSFFFSGEGEIGDWPALHPYGATLPGLSPTVMDAACAIDGASEDPVAAAPTITTNHAYMQQYTWSSEGYHDTTPWVMSPVIEVDVPGIYPTILEVVAKNFGVRRSNGSYGGQTMMIISGLCVWCGPRK